MLASSRILDDTEIVIALNLDAAPRADYVTADANLSAVRAKLKNLLEPRTQFAVEARGNRSAVKMPLRRMVWRYCGELSVGKINDRACVEAERATELSWHATFFTADMALVRCRWIG